MAKQLNVSMNFTANTSQAKSQIQDLSNMLNKIAYGTDLKVNASGISEASTAAKELSYHLKNAYNVKTGNFDLSALNKSLKGANTDITQLSNKLLTAGKTGQEAFVKLSQTIAQADQPVITMGTHLNNLFNTLKNTLRWQISNSMITGVTGAIQQAFYYAQDLDKSLNNIRIVTSKSSDEMAKFAKEANAAARSLSTTTTKYTDASLIYYQQGLDDEAVKARTDATVKMANVTGDTAETVSSQMTAIWNNFDDGSKKLEYYADVITALGAATASSSAEIAEGLEKFASVADTVGLSYDYATSALATVVAATRQSADVVGTSFKTLFARIEGLKLNGVDEEDGTTLNKYSQALADVGVNIKDANGELKDMDEILNDLGEKWQGLDKDTRVALAQTVGGARQYTQLIALMDNWGEFQKNLGVAQGSEGTLEEQAEIYAESWQAAKDRVRASAEGIYDSLINEDFFKDLDNWLSKMLDGIGDFIDGIGGIKGVLLTVGAIATSLLSKQVGPAVEKLKQNFSVLTGGAQKAYTKINEDTKSMVSNQLATGNYSEEQKLELEGNARILSMKAKLAQAADTLSEKERGQAEFAIQSMEMQNKEAFELLENKKKAEKAYDDQTKKIKEQTEATKKLRETELKQAKDELVYGKNGKLALNRVLTTNNGLKGYQNIIETSNLKNDNQIKTAEALNAASSADIDQMTENFYKLISGSEQAVDKLKIYENEVNQIRNLRLGSDATVQDLRDTEAVLNELIETLPLTTQEADKLRTIFKSEDTNVFNKGITELSQILADTGKNVTSTEGKMQILIKTLKLKGVNVEEVAKKYQKLKEKVDEANQKLEEAKKAENADVAELERLENEATKAKDALNDYSKSLDKAAESSENLKHHAGALESITGFIGGLGSAAMGLNSLKSAVEGIANPDASGWEKFSSAIMGVSFGAPMVIDGIRKMVTNFGGLKDSVKSATEVMKGTTKVNSLLKAGYIESTLAIEAEAAVEDEATMTFWANTLAKEGNMTVDEARVVITKMAAGATLEEAAATATLEATLLPLIGTIGIVVAVLALLAGGIYLTYQRTHQARIEAKKAAESYKEVSEAFNEVKSSVDEVNSSLDGLADRYESIEDMTYGTTEWGKSVRELNKEMEELIEKYKLIEGKDWYRDAEGVIRLTEAGQEAARSNANDQLKAAERAKDAAELRVKTTQIAADKEVLNNKYNYYSARKESAYLSYAEAQEQGYTGTNAQYNRGGDKSNYKRVDNTVSTDLINQIIDYMAQNPGETLEQAMNNLGIDENIQNLINKNDELKTSIEDLSEATREAADAYKNEVIDQLLGSKELENIDEDYRTGVLEQIGEGSKEQVEARAATIDVNDKLKQDYADALGYKYNKNNEFYKTDENGNALTNETVEIDEDTIASWQALNEIVGENEESIKNYVETVEESKKVWEAAGNVKDEWNEIKDNTEDATDALIDFVKNGKHTGDFATMVGATADEFQKIIDNGNFLDETTLPLMQDAINGDAEAAEELRNKFAWAKLEMEAMKADADSPLRLMLDDGSARATFDNLVSQIDQAEVGMQLFLNDGPAREAFLNLCMAMEQQAAGSGKAMAESLGVDIEWEQVTAPSDYELPDSNNPRAKSKYHLETNAWVPKMKFGKNNSYSGDFSELSFTKRSNGDIVQSSSYSNPTTPSTKTPDTGSDKDKSGGGSKDHQEKDDSEAERYYVINQVLKELTHQMNQLNKEEDRAFGANKIKAMNNKLALLKQQKKAQEEYLREAKDVYLKQDQDALKDLFNGKFNKDGIFTNYDDVFAKEQKAYNDAVAKYNKSKQTDADKNKLAEAEARWNKFTELAKQYETDLQDVQQAEEDIQDTINEMADLSLEIIQYSVQIRLDVDEDTRKYLDFLMNGAERKEFNVAEKIAIAGQNAQTYLNDRNMAEAGINSLLGQHGVSLDQASKMSKKQLLDLGLTEDEVSQLREWMDTIVESDEALADLSETINDYVLEAFNEWTDKIEKNFETFDHGAKVLNNYKNILGLIDQKAKGINRTFIDDLNKNILNNAKNKYEASKIYYNELLAEQAAAERELQNAQKRHDETSIRQWSQNLEEIQDKVRSANENMLDNWQEVLELAQKNFEETVKATLDAMYDGVSNLANFDLLKQQFEYEKDLADDYVDDFNKAYELNKLSRQVLNSIDDTKGLKNKELLRDLQQEITDLQASGAQMSKYDLEYLQKKYELRKAEIALEETQNAKTTVRMRQDNEGNWGYVYTANQDNVDKAQQTYEDKLADLYNLTKQYSESTQSEYMKILEEYNKAVEDAATRYGNDTEAFGQAMTAIQDFYSQKLNYYSDELSKTFQNNAELYNFDAQYYQEMTGNNILQSEMFQQKFEETILGSLNGLKDKTLPELNQTIAQAWENTQSTISQAHKDMNMELYGSEDGSGTGGLVGDIKNATENAEQDIKTASDNAKTAVEDDTEAMRSDMQLVMDKVVAWQTKWNKKIAKITADDAKVIKDLDDIIANLSTINSTNPNPKVTVEYKGVDQLDDVINKLGKIKSKTITVTTKYVATGNPSGDDSSSNNYDPSKDSDTRNTTTKPTLHQYKQYSGGETYIGYGAPKTKTINSKTYASWDNNEWFLASDIKNYQSRYYMIGHGRSSYQYYDTGGYTGEWDSSGKLAVLHQKEIVLNKDDTANFLAGISVLRDIVKQIDLRSLAERQALSNISVSVPRDSSSTLQQNVTINAEFPAAQNHSEIEMAFDNLLGKALQYANRNK